MSKSNAPDIHKWIHFIPLEDVTSDMYDLNMEKRTHGENTEPCLLCGNPIKKGKPYKIVHLLTDGNLVSSDEDFDNCQGYHKIGPDCARKLPNSFTFDDSK